MEIAIHVEGHNYRKKLNEIAWTLQFIIFVIVQLTLKKKVYNKYVCYKQMKPRSLSLSWAGSIIALETARYPFANTPPIDRQCRQREIFERDTWIAYANF